MPSAARSFGLIRVTNPYNERCQMVMIRQKTEEGGERAGGTARAAGRPARKPVVQDRNFRSFRWSRASGQAMRRMSRTSCSLLSKA